MCCHGFDLFVIANSFVYNLIIQATDILNGSIHSKSDLATLFGKNLMYTRCNDPDLDDYDIHVSLNLLFCTVI